VIAPSNALAAIPGALRDPLLEEHRSITQNYFEHRWTPAELSGGRFCEIVYTILHGHSTGVYAAGPGKPPDFVSACRTLEKNTHVPRSFQILIPRLLPLLYEVRNNRGVGHVGGDVDSNHMDATAVLSMANWVMAELVRVFHGLTVGEAQAVVDALVERRIPVVWSTGNVKRVLEPSLELGDQIVVLLAASSGPVGLEALRAWVEYDNTTYFRKLLRKMHASREIEFTAETQMLELLPPGSRRAEAVLRELRPT
jgi:hypothetical protein